MKKLILLIALILLGACAYVDPSITDQTVIYTDAPVRLSRLQLSVRPKGPHPRPLTAFFAPFIINQETGDADQLSREFGSIFYHAWTEERIFPTFEYGTDVRFRGLNRVMNQAKSKGADLLVLGQVPYFYLGSTLDDTALTIQISIYQVETGTLLWTMSQSGRLESVKPDDYIYVRHESRLPEAPVNVIIRAIAKDMAIPVKSWLPDPDRQFPFAEDKPSMLSALTSPQPRDMQAAMAPDGPDDHPVMESDIQAAPPPPDRMNDAQQLRPDNPAVNLAVQFDFDKATIRPESTPILDSLGQALNSPQLKGRKIIVAGHTDASGDAGYNVRLSRKRAEAVRSYLEQNWRIDPTLMEAVGYGQSRPVDTSGTAQARQRNRRVEIRLAQ